MKKRSRHSRVRTSPALVGFFLKSDMFVQHRMACHLVRTGCGTTAHYNLLNDCYDLIRLSDRPGDDITLTLFVAAEAFDAISDRFARTGRLAVTGEEGKALQQLVDFSEDFWPRQSGHTYIKANAKVEALRDSQRAIAKAKASAKAATEIPA